MSARVSIIIRYITTTLILGLAVLSVAISYNSWKEIGQVAPADGRTSAYFEQYPNLTVRLRAPGMTGSATNG